MNRTTFHCYMMDVKVNYIQIVTMTEGTEYQIKKDHYSALIEHPSLLCPSAHKITSLCIENQCEAANALMCQQSSCLDCSEKHSNCGELVKFTKITKLLQQKSDIESQLVQKIHDVQQTIHKRAVELIKIQSHNYSFNFLEDQERSILEKIYLEKKLVSFQTGQAHQLLVKLKSGRMTEKKDKSQIIMENYKKQMENISCLIEKCILKTFGSYFDDQQMNQEKTASSVKDTFVRTVRKSKRFIRKRKEKTTIVKDKKALVKENKPVIKEKKPQVQENKSNIKVNKQLFTENKPIVIDVDEQDSLEAPEQIINFEQIQLKQEDYQANYLLQISKKLVLQSFLEAESQSNIENFLNITKIIDKSNQEQLQFIKKSLNNPSKMYLLFRASEHNFLASKFHEACDNKEHTFTLIQTQMNTIIAGYTPLSWSSGPPTFKYDSTNSSFLLSVNLKEKIKLVEPSKAILCYSDMGPCFGRGDLVIRNECNSKQLCSGGLPRSYSGSFDLCNRGQVADLSGYKFKVKEYEVYRVHW